MLIAQRAQSQIELKKEGKGELHNKTHQNNLETTFVAKRDAAPVAEATPVFNRIHRRACLSSVAAVLHKQLFFFFLSFLVKRMNL